MAKINGRHVCDYCKVEFPWDYQIPNRLSDMRYDVEPIIPNVAHCSRRNSIYDDYYVLSTYCPRCHRLNSFSHTPDK